ncbi:hypothetical protein SO802_003660 [Lithocarpus litseifolius]|uniref:Uncharacterized protein n=1 Tax=Lithocarpus litseifolius TaxID=425828 RepID=A0AAW2E624_9ROSI
MGESDATSEKFWWSYKRMRSSNSGTGVWGKEMEERLKGISSSSGEGTPSSASGRRVESMVLFMEESEPKKEGIAQGHKKFKILVINHWEEEFTNFYQIKTT